ncbi:class I SAM-dependent methyltransferase [Bailinhaonella thermotolerans]|uniref:class I SAM-dependent methyltransferase n=1 Tax=Bailinhaonella thermotolerans TaxID=1070861 RepID=UPI001F5B0B5E|nr:class I SAM-dependent methyltransferase [Bailinhaonella thermotolerans]
MTEVRQPPTTCTDVFAARTRELWNEALGRRLDILIAGCGRPLPDSPLRTGLNAGETRITGVDEDRPALRARAQMRGDLDEWKLGDLRSVPLPQRSVDVVRCEFLLERIRHAELVLDRLVAALRPGGLILLRLRDGGTAYGFWARAVPRPLRALFWSRLAPPDEVGPLPAVYEPVSSREGIHAYCLMRGLVIAEEHLATSGNALRGRFAPLASAACRLVAILSAGRLTATHDEVTLVIRKPQNHFARLL